MSIQNISAFEGILNYLGFPASFKAELVQLAEHDQRYRAMFSFNFSLSGSKNQAETVRLIKEPVDEFFAELLESEPVKKELSKRDLIISEKIKVIKEKEYELNQKKLFIEKLMVYKHHFDKAKELRQ